MKGIDVSNFQGATFDWAAAKAAGVTFAFAKATEGLTFGDADFARNWARMKASGIHRGAYHYAHPANDPFKEAAHFLAVVRSHGLEPGDLLALDLEDADGKTPGQVAAWSLAFAMQIHSAVRAWPVAYVNQNFARNGYCDGLGKCPLWLANPSHVKVALPIGPWDLISFEQTGSPGGVDADIFYGDARQIAELGVPAPAPAPAPQPAPQPDRHGYLVPTEPLGVPFAVTGRLVTAADTGKPAWF